MLEEPKPIGARRLREFVADAFQFENIKVFMETPNQVFGEYEFTAVSSKTGRSVHQLFFGRMVTENGEII